MSSSLARKGASVFASNWVVLPFQFLAGVLAVRVLGAEGKGTLSLIIAGLNLLSAIGQFGMPNAATFLLRQGRGDARALLLRFGWVVAAFTLAVGLLALLLGKTASLLVFGEVLITGPLAAAAFACLPAMMVTAFLGSLYLAQGDARAYSGQVVLLAIANLTGTLVLVVVLRWGVLGGVLALGVGHLLAALAGVGGVLARGRNAAGVMSPGLFGEMLSLGCQNYLVSIGTLVFKRVDLFLIQGMLGTSAVGYYSVARVPFDSLLTIPRAVNGMLAGEASGAGREEAGALVAMVVRNVVWIMICVTLPAAIFAPIIVPLFYGADFSASVAPMILLLVASVFMGGAGSLQTFFVGIGKPVVNARATLVSGLVAVVGSALLMPAAGLLGAAMGALGGMLLLFAMQGASFVRFAGQGWAEILRPDRESMAFVYRKLRKRVSG